MAGSHFRAPLAVKLADGSSVTIVDSSGAITGAVTPGSFSADTLFTTDKKIEFRATTQYIHSPSAGKLAIVASVAGADDISLTGGTTITGTLAVTGAIAIGEDVTFATNKKAIFRSSGISVSSGAAGKLTITADGVGADDITLDGAITLTDNVTVPTSKKIIFRSTGIYINSGAVGKLSIVADGGGADDITLSGGVTISGSVAATGTHTQTGAVIASVGLQAVATAVTATTDGTGTGIVPVNTSHVTVTSSSSANIVTLPAPTPGRRLILFVGANGYNLQSTTPASIGINGGTGSGVKSAVSANVTVYLTCVSATAWVGFQQTSAGTVSAVAVAA